MVEMLNMDYLQAENVSGAFTRLCWDLWFYKVSMLGVSWSIEERLSISKTTIWEYGNWILGESSNKFILNAASHFTFRTAKKTNNNNNKTSLRIILNHLWKKRGLGERGEGKGASKHKTTSINYPKHSLQAMLATLLRYNNSRNLFCFCCYNFPTLNQSFKGGSFHISNTEDYTTCQKQTILFSAGLRGVGFPTWLGISVLKFLVHYFLLSLPVMIES